MKPTTVKAGQQWTRTERSRPGRSVVNRDRLVEVLNVTTEVLFPYARVRDLTTKRVTHIQCSRLEREWKLVPEAPAEPSRGQPMTHQQLIELIIHDINTLSPDYIK